MRWPGNWLFPRFSAGRTLRRPSRSSTTLPMFAPFFNLAQRIARSNAPRVPEGERIYAIGDVHGRLDCLDALIARMAADDAGRPPANTTYVFLGDLVDRGPDSKGVVERLLQFSRSGRPCRFIKGNHESVFVDAAEGDAKGARMLVRMGGRSTMLSYGISEADYDALDYPELAARLAELVPHEHRAFLSAFEMYAVYGDYLFVHAGIRPGVPLEEQRIEDLCWIRQPFLNHRRSFGPMVVHGHTVTEEVEERSNRIGIDTGAFASGRLTALGLEGETRWFLTT
jgi:serine/threonine protein phosphatase 1